MSNKYWTGDENNWYYSDKDAKLVAAEIKNIPLVLFRRARATQKTSMVVANN
jgi:hypothetical protein